LELVDGSRFAFQQSLMPLTILGLFLSSNQLEALNFIL
jgi:hypothetical protein